MSEASEVSKITRSAGVVALFTLLSRVFGAVRDIIVFHVFGASAATDAFFVAFTIPNVFRRLVAEGALTIAFIPVYTETREKQGPEAARRFANAVFTLLFLVVGVTVVLGSLFSGAMVYAFASGFAGDPAQFALASQLTRWMFPYLLFISAVALCMGLLNANKHFAAPAAAPVLLNIAIITSVIWADLFDPPIFSMAVGVLVGGVAQLSLQIPVLIRRGLLPRPSFQFNQAPVKKLLRLMGPAVFGLAVYQINIVVLRQLASYLPQGQISYYYNANRLTELALGVFAIAIATAALPSLSEQASRGETKALLKTFRDAFVLTNFVTIPATVGLGVLALPIVSVLYLHGQFTLSDATATSHALLAFAPGLVAIATVRVVVQTFYALSDTRSPTEVATVVLFLNTFIGMILVDPFEVQGLAATLSITSAAQAFLLMLLLRRKLGPIGLRQVAGASLRQLLTGIVMGAVVLAVAQLGDWSLGPKSLVNIGVLFFAISLGVGVYAALNLALGAAEAKTLLQAIQRRRKPPVIST